MPLPSSFPTALFLLGEPHEIIKYYQKPRSFPVALLLPPLLSLLLSLPPNTLAQLLPIRIAPAISFNSSEGYPLLFNTSTNSRH
uniref:2-C-methyl-D-erythritol 2,4-cyclodiphosphate synthase n=1 Tax=Arundo donax TaxID=35708 RepID=A0A0A9C791_ARUDO